MYSKNLSSVILAGVFYVNEDVFDNYFKNKVLGDSLLSDGNYEDAYKKYRDANSFQYKYSRGRLVDYFLTMTLFLRCIVCKYLSKQSLEEAVSKYMIESVGTILKELQSSEMMNLHSKMINDYYAVFSKLTSDCLEEKEYLSFINRYIF